MKRVESPPKKRALQVWSKLVHREIVNTRTSITFRNDQASSPTQSEEKPLAAAAQAVKVTEGRAIFKPAALCETTDRDRAPISHLLCCDNREWRKLYPKNPRAKPVNFEHFRSYRPQEETKGR